MIIKIRLSAVPAAPVAYDQLAEVVAQAIGPNEAYPDNMQLAAHRQRQTCTERFMKIESKEIAQ